MFITHNEVNSLSSLFVAATKTRKNIANAKKIANALEE